MLMLLSVAVAGDEDDNDDDVKANFDDIITKIQQHRLYQCLMTSWTHDEALRRSAFSHHPQKRTAGNLNGEFII